MPPSDGKPDRKAAPRLKRLLLPTKAFTRTAKRFVRKNPGCADDLRIALDLLAEDAFNPALKTHNLKGKLSGSLACSAGYDLRVVFQFVRHKGAEALLLAAVGSLDEVY